MSGADFERSGRGLVLFGLIVGALAAYALYAIGEYWLADAERADPIPIVVMQTVALFAGGWVVLAERRDLFRPVVPAAVIAAVLAYPTYWLVSNLAVEDARLSEAPMGFWVLLGLPLSAFLMTALAKSYVLGHGGRNYTALFFHGLTLPLILGCAKLFAGLSLLLLFAWSTLLKALGVEIFEDVFQQPWFILPFLGGVGGLSIGLIRSQQAVLGALRFILLLLARLLTPIMAVFSVTLVVVLAVQGSGAILQFDYVAGILLGLAFAGMLIVNGVYQNGEGAPPPAWLRLSAIVVIATLPLFVGLSAYAFSLRIGEYGLTPLRIYGLAANALGVAYAGVLIIGLLSELNWRKSRWMPTLAPLNSLLATVWTAVLILLSTPIVNTWALSAASQERVFLSGKINAEEFDFGYLHFKLGSYGAAVLDRLLTIEDHPESATIRARIQSARSFDNHWTYQRYIEGYDVPATTEAESESGNGTGASAFEDDAAHIEDLQDLPLAPEAAQSEN